MTSSSTAEHGDIRLDSSACDAQRVVAYPLDVGAVSALPPGERFAGFDAKQLCLRHFYTGDGLFANVKSTEKSSKSVFVPHGTGTMACALYAKPNTTFSASVKSSLLPHTVLVECYGEVKDLRNVPLLSLAVYSGDFLHGKRHGRGKLTVCKKYTIVCDWDSDAPQLDGTLCLLDIFHNSSAENASRRTSQYAGMVTLRSANGAAFVQSALVGLAWAHQAEFVADGMGEMHALRGMQRCGRWKGGQRNGFGVEFDPTAGTVYMGNFAEDQRDGPGALTYCTTGALLCGNWKDGKLTVSGDLVFPSWPFTLQGALWKNSETHAFEKGKFVRSNGSLSGVWEPLFAALDEVFATSAMDQQQQQPFRSTTRNNCKEKTQADATSEAHTQDTPKTDDGAEETSGFLLLFSIMMQRSDFTSVLAAFQRCYYFLYKPCLATACKESQDIAAALAKAGMPAIVQELALLGHRPAALSVETGGWTPPSWCEEMCRANTSPLCPHDRTFSESLATRMSPAKLFECAMHDLASFVSSVRLRLLSYVAAHPAAYGVSVSKSLIAACWDAVFALVAPVVHELAAAADAAATTETLLALGRCGELRAEDFVHVDSLQARQQQRIDRFLHSSCGGGLGSHDSGENENSIAWPFASPARHARRGVLMTSNGPLFFFDEQSGAAYPSLAKMFSFFHAAWREARGLFPACPLRQERWMCVRILDAFSDRSDEPFVGGANAVLNPVAVLRVLRMLASGVNLKYPLPLDEKKNKRNYVSVDAPGYATRSAQAKDMADSKAYEEEEDSEEEEEERNEVKLVMTVLDAADAALTRLRHTYPSICRDDSGAMCVYPLDELDVRARFVLLAASGSISIETIPKHRAMHQTVSFMKALISEQRGENEADDDDESDGDFAPARSVREFVLWAAECVGGVLNSASGPQETVLGKGLWSLFLPCGRTAAENTTGPITDSSGDETAHFSLLQQFLADVGICFELRVRRCYDNEEDALEALVPARCVGKEATLSLHVPDGFVGGLACEALADAWLHTLLALRGTATRRKSTLIDLSRPNSTD